MLGIQGRIYFIVSIEYALCAIDEMENITFLLDD